MKVFMLGGYGDVEAKTYVNYTNDEEGQRLVDLKCARLLTTNERDENFEADKAATFVDFPAPAAPAPKGKGSQA